MKNLMLKLSVFVMLLTLISCSSSNHVASNSILQKRKHNKGFYFNAPWNNHKPIAKYEAKPEEKIAEAIVPSPSEAQPEEHKTHERPILNELKNAGRSYEKAASEATRARDFVKASKKLNNSVKKVFSEFPEKALIQKDGIEESPSSKTSGLAIASLILGILSFYIVPIIGGILAIIFGTVALKDIAEAYKNGRGLALAGIILGIISTIIWILYIIFVIALVSSIGY